MARAIKSARQAAEKQIISFLTKKGEKIAVNALRSVTYLAETNNLDDSFVWGVYSHGKLVDGAYGCAQAQEATEPRKWYGKELYGHEVAMSFIRNYKPIRKGFALVVAACMPYGEVLENGGGGLKKKYRVIATAKNELQALTGKFKDSRTRIIHRGKAQ